MGEVYLSSTFHKEVIVGIYVHVVLLFTMMDFFLGVGESQKSVD